MFSVQQKARWSVSSSQDTSQPRVVADPGMCRSLLPGNREISIAVPTSRGRASLGEAAGREAVADDEREGEVGPARSSREASEQSGLGCGGACGAKGRGQGECGTAKHGPDAEPGSPATGAGPHTRSRQQEQTGQADGAPASPHHRCSAGKLLWFEEVRCAGRRRDDLEPLTPMPQWCRGTARGRRRTESNAHHYLGPSECDLSVSRSCVAKFALDLVKKKFS